ncbi:MAG: glycosyltransferase family 4 protein [Algoriphagus sp.]|uniref:glycosyltransferase family 4 protein n=1 Tax=Algoriphagus sp. TaxID=1872435 RepID=UPI0017A0D968|nr:glycosyltransferase family 4 protein [Algoriphagus sp.]NVJ86770.1 glycosyltransferase family 4 protein [Algoriphagus sp.]
MTIKIAQLVDSLNLGGTERMAVNIANSLANEGIESHLLVTRKVGGLSSFVQSNVSIKVFNKRSKLDLISFFHLLRHLTKENPDILHVHQTSIFWAIFLKVFLPQTKLLWHDHFGQSEMLELYPRKEMKLIMPFIDAVIVVNEIIKNYWQERFPEKKQSIFYLKNFPEFLKINRVYSQSEVLSIINIANFRKQKDQLTLLDALKILKSEGFLFKAFLIGEFVDLNWVESVRERIILNGLENEVKIVGPVSNLIPYLESGNIGILSSESEGLPVALLEYGMAGLPTVVTQVGQCGEVLGFGEYGWVVPPKSPSNLAQAIKEIFLDPDNAEKKGQKLKVHINKNFGPNNFLNHYFDIINSLVIQKK